MMEVICNEKTYFKKLTVSREYIQARKDGRPYFDMQKCAEDLAKHLISSGCIFISEPNHRLDCDKVEVFLYARVLKKEPILL